MDIKSYIPSPRQQFPAPNPAAHCLIGPPGSGKSTLARRIAQELPSSVIISTDQLRATLYGDPAHQGSWQEIFALAQQQVEQAHAEGWPIVYDATNARRPWRVEWLRAFAALPLDWIGWHLQTPLAICQQWNQSRQRRVPPLVVERFHQALIQCPPTCQEGFFQVYRVLPQISEAQLTQILRVWHSP